MKRLILMRHAKTENWFQGTDDEARALVARGWTDARAMSQALVERSWVPDKVIMSSARRTRETWKAMSEYMPGIEHGVLEALYLVTPEELFDLALENWEGVETLLVIGHNPGMHDLARALARDHSSSDAIGTKALGAKMPTCGTALFEQDDSGAPLEQTLRLAEFIAAKDLRE